MIGIPDWSNEPLANLDEIAKRNAAIDAELAEMRQNKTYAEMQDGEIVPVYEYHYTGTVDVWAENSIKA
jgi:hypothetical protein